MDAVRGLSGLNINLTPGTLSATAAATTITFGAAIRPILDGLFLPTVTAAAKALNLFLSDGFTQVGTIGFQTTPVLLSTTASGQAAAVVHCVGLAKSNAATIPVALGIVLSAAEIASGVTLVPVVASIVGPVTNIDANGQMIGGHIKYPSIPDHLVPVGYFIVQNLPASSTATFTFGTTNWNATSIVTTAFDVSALPKRSRKSLTGYY